jgi:4-azaleucine resistance transporter AzlC
MRLYATDPETRPILRDAMGVGAAVGAFGVSFGALAVASGLSPAQTIATSLLVFTGASQFAFIGVLAGGGGALAALVPAVLLAVRNCLYGLSLVPVLGGRTGRRLLKAHLVIDESTAMARAQRSTALAHRAFLATGVSVLVLWNAGTIAGVAFGRAVGDPRALGLDAMFPAAFLALLAPQLARSGARSTALLGGMLAVACVPFTPAGVPVVVACAAVVPALARSRRTHYRQAGG